MVPAQEFQKQSSNLTEECLISAEPAVNFRQNLRFYKNRHSMPKLWSSCGLNSANPRLDTASGKDTYLTFFGKLWVIL